MSTASRSIRRRRLQTAIFALPLGLLALVATTPANASGGETGLITITPATPASEPSGSPTTYSVAVSCEGTAGASCGGSGDSTITIPLVGTNTTPADMSTWAYSAVAGTSGLITSGPTVVSNGTGGFNLVLTLDSTLFVSGYSGTLSLKVTPPDNTTPDHTPRTLTPTLSGGDITSVVAPTPATGEATATVLTADSTDGTFSVTASSAGLSETASLRAIPAQPGPLFRSSSPAVPTRSRLSERRSAPPGCHGRRFPREPGAGREGEGHRDGTKPGRTGPTGPGGQPRGRQGGRARGPGGG